MPERKEKRKRNICCALLAFGKDVEAGEHLFRTYRRSAFDDLTASFLAGFEFDPEQVSEGVQAIKQALPDAESRMLAVLATAPVVEHAIEKYQGLAKRFRLELYIEIPPFPLSVMVRYARRGIAPTLYQYKLLKNRPEHFDEISLALLTTVGDVGTVLDRYRSISALDSTIPMQAKAILTAHPKDFRQLKTAYGVMMREKEEYARIGREPFDNMVAAILALGDDPNTILYQFKRFKQSLIWSGA